MATKIQSEIQKLVNLVEAHKNFQTFLSELHDLLDRYGFSAQTETQKTRKPAKAAKTGRARTFHDGLSQKDRDAFWARVDKKERHWLWKGNFQGDLPVLHSKSGSRSARRVAWMIGAKPNVGRHMLALTCGNQKCVNPDHMAMGRRKEEPKSVQRAKRKAAKKAAKAANELTGEDIFNIGIQAIMSKDSEAPNPQ